MRETKLRGIAPSPTPTVSILPPPELAGDPELALARFVTETDFEDLPQEIVDFSKKHILDTFACMIGGSTQGTIPEIVGIVKEMGGKEESYIPLWGGKVPAPMAAFAIGPMTRALDFGDSHPAFPGHTAEFVLPPLVAALGLKGKVSGKELVTAFALGEEVLCKVGYALSRKSIPHPGYEMGGHYLFGAVAGVAKLLGFNSEQVISAFGLASEMKEPHRQNSGTWGVRIIHAFVSQDAITICLLAKAGIIGPRDVFLGKNGFLYNVTKGTWKVYPEKLAKDLGKEWLFPLTNLKASSACLYTHNGIGSLLELMSENNIKVKDIEKIHATVHPKGFATVCDPHEMKWNPQTVPECQFSLPYVLATTAFEGGFFPVHLEKKAMERKSVREFMKRITASESSEFTAPWETEITITLKDGREFSRRAIHAKGSPEKPLSVEDIVRKLKGVIIHSHYKLTPAKVDLFIDRVLHLEQVKDVEEELILLITPS